MLVRPVHLIEDREDDDEVDVPASQEARVVLATFPTPDADALGEELRVESGAVLEELIHPDLVVARSEDPVGRPAHEGVGTDEREHRRVGVTAKRGPRRLDVALLQQPDVNHQHHEDGCGCEPAPCAAPICMW